MMPGMPTLSLCSSSNTQPTLHLDKPLRSEGRGASQTQKGQMLYQMKVGLAG